MKTTISIIPWATATIGVLMTGPAGCGKGDDGGAFLGRPGHHRVCQ